ncbi:MAG TPA: SMP-30/gluconolactonase/LRE family protein [Gemmatimonadaceae bacterium]
MTPELRASRTALVGVCVVFSFACDSPPRTIEPPTEWSFDSTMVFPSQRGLHGPEDGVALPAGRLLVSDAISGLRLIETDGSSRPFGGMVAAGYVHSPPSREGGANGVSLESDGTHALVTDIEAGSIYRVNVSTGAAERVYQHGYGINAAVRDSRGTIWFTQSAQNTAETGLGRMWAAVDAGSSEGALLRVTMSGDQVSASAEVVLDSLAFPNGVVLDERNGHLYVSEMMAGRVLRYRVDPATGALSERAVVFEGHAVDNLEMDDEGNLWMVAPISNQVFVLNTATGATHTAFKVQSPVQMERAAEFDARGKRGESRMELLSPEQWAPLPGFITGVILSPARGPVYLTGLGDALIRLNR